MEVKKIIHLGVLIKKQKQKRMKLEIETEMVQVYMHLYNVCIYQLP